MNRDRVGLPTDKDALAQLIDVHCRRERIKNVIRFTMYKLAHAYMAGARSFRQLNLETGEVMSEWTDSEGNIEFRSSDLLHAFNQIASQLSGGDLRPKVEATGQTLASVRSSATARVIADALFGEQEVQRAGRDFAWLLTMLGSCGITSDVRDHSAPGIGLTGDLEIVHPRELFPFPTVDEDYTKAFGMVRERPVSMGTLKDIYGTRKINAQSSKMFWEQRVIGEAPQGDNLSGVPAGISMKVADDGGSFNEGDETKEGYAIVRELWLGGPRGTCGRYIVTSGLATLSDEDYEGVEKYCPIGRARFLDNGTWYGAGGFDLLFSISRELERLVKSLFNNIRDTDRYGCVILPQGVYNEKTTMKDMGRGLRGLFVETDALGGEGFKPFVMQPWNSGDMPGKVAAFAQQYLGSLNPIRDILREKGRVDSASGLAFLDESSRRALTNPTQAMEMAFGDCYRSAVGTATTLLVDSQRALPIDSLDLNLAGAVIDWKNNKVSFASNPIPTLSRLKFSIREANPKSEVAQVQFGLQMVKDQQIPMEKFIIEAVEKGWDLPFWMGDMKAAVAVVIRNILTLYNDGVTPGVMVTTPDLSRADIQLAILSAFMSDTPMQVASVDVQDEFIRYKQKLTQWTGRVLPEQLPYNPDDLASVQQGVLGAQMSNENAMQGQLAMQGQPQ